MRHGRGGHPFAKVMTITAILAPAPLVWGCQAAGAGEQSGGSTGEGTTATQAEGSDTAAEPSWDTVLEVDEAVGSFFSVWGASLDTLYAVGGQTFEGGASQGAMYRYDGASWRVVDLPPGTAALNWVFGVGDHRFAVGDAGVVLHREGDDDATPWTPGDCGTGLALWGIWGASPDDVWIVGGDGFMRPPVLCHFDGVEFAPFEIPSLQVQSRGFFKVWGTAADHVFAVGHKGIILHFDGESWTEQTSGTTEDLIALWGRAPDEILAVGGRAEGILARFDGTAWTSTSIPGIQGLNGIWMDDSGDAVIVGPFGIAALVPRGQLTPQLEDSTTNLALHAVFSPTPGQIQAGHELIAAGGSLDASPPYTGIIIHRR